MKALVCWWSGFAGTWLDPGIWPVRFRVLLTPGRWPMAWPGIRFDGHLYDTENRRFEVDGGREHEFTPCARCGKEIYTGWRTFYGDPNPDTGDDDSPSTVTIHRTI